MSLKQRLEVLSESSFYTSPCVYGKHGVINLLQLVSMLSFLIHMLAPKTATCHANIFQTHEYFCVQPVTSLICWQHPMQLQGIIGRIFAYGTFLQLTTSRYLLCWLYQKQAIVFEIFIAIYHPHPQPNFVFNAIVMVLAFLLLNCCLVSIGNNRYVM